MKTKKDIMGLLKLNTKSLEKELGIKIRNGQSIQAIRSVCRWMEKQISNKIKEWIKQVNISNGEL